MLTVDNISRELMSIQDKLSFCWIVRCTLILLLMLSSCLGYFFVNFVLSMMLPLRPINILNDFKSAYQSRRCVMMFRALLCCCCCCRWRLCKVRWTVVVWCETDVSALALSSSKDSRYRRICWIAVVKARQLPVGTQSEPARRLRLPNPFKAVFTLSLQYCIFI